MLFALGDPGRRRAVLAAHDAAVVALAGWIERHAHTRYRIGGEVATVDAEGIVGALFRQHTSRALDPQVHTHLVIANRVRSPDGRWLALDARLIKHDQRTLSAIYHAGLRAELTGRLGVRWQRPEHGIAEIVDVPADVLTMFSTRTETIRRRIDDKLDHFLQSMGREPTVRERWRLEREAAIDSRLAKGDAFDGRILHAHWAAQALGYQPARIVTNAVGRVRDRRGIDHPTAVAIVEWAMTTIAGRQSSWRPTELHREIAAAIPTETAVDAAGLVGWIDRVVAGLAVARCVDLSRPVPVGVLLRGRDGRPVSESVLDRALTTQTILDQEIAIIGWADRRLAYPGVPEPAAVTCSPAHYVAEHVELAYARTGTGSQGRTVKHAIVYLDRATDVRNIYVPMTRGTTTNMAYIAVTGEQTAHDVFARSLTTDWIDQPAPTRHSELNPTTPTVPASSTTLPFANT